MSIRYILPAILVTIITLPAVQVAAGERQAGDTIADAVVIPALPFTDTGTTVGYANDFDEVCPYTGSLAPDVVYAFTPAAGVVVEIDLCESGYDTKLYVYDADLALRACNDDYVSPYCSLLRSHLDGVLLDAGVTYYLVIDGYGTATGDYVLHVEAADGCVLESPAGTTPEGEPPLTVDYTDITNGGCSSPDPSHPVQALTGDASGAFLLAGQSGWYATAGDSQSTRTISPWRSAPPAPSTAPSTPSCGTTSTWPLPSSAISRARLSLMPSAALATPAASSSRARPALSCGCYSIP